ncbi:hypothetical protein ABZ897_00950 [Nonomuraea sp. NPDC046802]|uniref:hypothetical protein n=1 Tax=Nonomuraea sp. NPDC046802 TaxID=3154919 RepID=UPI00340AE6BC
MRARLTALKRRLSQRGAFLLLLAVFDLVYASGLAWAPAETRATPTYVFLASLLPLGAWAVVWAVVGLLCLVQAWTAQDRFAYTAATALKILWALLHLGAWAFDVLLRGYISAAIWLLAAGAVMIMASVAKGGVR